MEPINTYRWRMPRPEMCVLVTIADDGSAVVQTFDLEHVDHAALGELLGDPAAEQILTPEQVGEHDAIGKGVVVFG